MSIYKYVCSLGHRGVKIKSNYVTKVVECGHAYCNAPIEKWYEQDGDKINYLFFENENTTFLDVLKDIQDTLKKQRGLDLPNES